ncbi:MAG: hypothetical protein E7455_01225 [Ruminococcaceae bacterium]|nr:hypothetical protein [Oscillospiraceae bacterium]
MMKTLKKVSLLLLVVVMVTSLFPVRAKALGEEQSYSYNYDLVGNALPAPDPYEVRFQIDVSDYTEGKLRAAASVFVAGDTLYICDTGNHRILQFELTQSEPIFVREIKETPEWTLSGPEDIFVSDNGDIYIADTGNQRILWLNSELKIKKIIERPTDVLFDSFREFKPSKLVSSGGRLYVQATGVNRGFMEFDEFGEFVGFMGASNVTFEWESYIWKLISTDAQKSQMESFVPTEYNNIALDAKGRIYATTSIFELADLNSGSANPVRKLNQKGKDILIRNNSLVIGDTNWGKDGPSRFKDVTVLDNDIFFVLDTTKKRIFAYDAQGSSLYIFGGYGTKAGYFTNPVSLEHWGDDLIVLDNSSALVTVMRPTEYGATIQSAIESYNEGRYEEAMLLWEDVLRKNGNYILAYDGIGKIMLRNGDYEQSLEYLKYADDDYYYSQAWKLFRKDWIERYLGWAILALALFLIIRLGLNIYNRERGALEDYEDRKRRVSRK